MCSADANEIEPLLMCEKWRQSNNYNSFCSAITTLFSVFIVSWCRFVTGSVDGRRYLRRRLHGLTRKTCDVNYFWTWMSFGVYLRFSVASLNCNEFAFLSAIFTSFGPLCGRFFWHRRSIYCSIQWTIAIAIAIFSWHSCVPNAN